MSRAVILDANVFKEYYSELVSEISEHASQLVHAIFLTDHLLIDDGDKIKLEWREASCGQAYDFFEAWVASRLIEDKIRLRKVQKGHEAKKFNEFGVPPKDRIYLHLAVSASAFALISRDIDMYEPKAKLWTEPKKKKLVESSSGCVCKYMKKAHGVLVVCPEVAKAHF